MTNETLIKFLLALTGKSSLDEVYKEIEEQAAANG